MKKTLLTLLIGSVLATPAYADNGCAPISLYLTYLITAPTYQQVKAEFDHRMDNANAFVSKERIRTFNVMSLTYDVHVEERAPGQPPPKPSANQIEDEYGLSPAAYYKLSGRAEFQVDATASGVKFAQYLAQELFEVTLNSAPSSNPMCAHKDIPRLQKFKAGIPMPDALTQQPPPLDMDQRR